MPAAGLPVDNTVAREGAGATELEGREDDAGVGDTIIPVERGAMDAVGSATGGRVDMFVWLFQEERSSKTVEFPCGS